MPTPWVITVPSTRAELDGAGRGEIPFSVANAGPVQDRAVFDLVVEDAANRAWFSVDEPQRVVPPGTSVTYVVRLAVPAGTPAGTHAVQGRVYSADTAPEESSALSPRVAIAIPATEAPPRKKPWWLIPIGVAVVAVIAVVALLLAGGDDGGGGGGDEGPAAVPDVRGRNVQEATATLEDAGFTVTIRNRNVLGTPPGEVIDQEPPEDTEADQGTEVILEVAVTFAPAVLRAPGNNQSFAESQGDQSIEWAPVDGAALYDVRITGTCLIRIPGFCSDVTVTDTVPDTSFVVVHDGLPRTYSWNVTPVDDFDGRGPTSETRQFTVVDG